MKEHMTAYKLNKSKIDFMLKTAPLYFNAFPIDPTPEEIASCGGDVKQALLHKDCVQRHVERKEVSDLSH